MVQAIGIIGRKCGMTRVFSEQGQALPVTLVEVEPNRITQLKTATKDGYEAVQVTTGSRHQNRVTKPLAGHYTKAKTAAGRGLWEFRLEADHAHDLKVGDEWGLEQFRKGLIVDVTATSKGKGYAGTVKRWNFQTQDFSHGNSLSHRAPGSIGQCQTPGRVFKGKKMAGHMGHEQVTVQNLEIIDVDSELSVLLIKGAVPGPNGSNVMIKPGLKAVKHNAAIFAAEPAEASEAAASADV